MLVFVERLFEPLALILVFGGTMVATIVTATRADLRRALGALRPLVSARPEQDGETADRAIRQIQRICEYKGVVCADRVKTPVEFVHQVAQRLAEAEGSDAFARWTAELLDERQVRHASAAAVWRSAADAAPAMGMIGTVLGLVQMFAELNDPVAMGPAMATAMLTTLYGLLIAAAIAGPIAARLERLSAAERRWQERVVTRLAAIAREEEESLRQWRERRRPRLAS